MKLLLDTHVAMWSIAGYELLDKKIYEMIMNPDNDIYYSTVTPWEIEIKHLKRPDKIKISGEQFADLCEQARFINLNIKNEHISELKNIVSKDKKQKHNDPFDKMLLAQARYENLVLVTHDKKFKLYNDSDHLLVF